MNFIWYILIGIAAGFLAGQVTKGSGFGLLVNLLIGIIGGVLGGWIFGLLGFQTTSLLGNLICATIGAIVLLWLVSWLKKTTAK